MAVVKQLNTAADFWLEMVEPDCSDYITNPCNLRCALHASISLFHMSDWVFHTHETQVGSAFTFTDHKSSIVRPVSKATEFANALEEQNADFGRIRGIANAAKHLELTDIRPVANAPSHAANTAIQADFVGADACGYGWLATGSSSSAVRRGGSTRVVLAGRNGNDMEFSNILSSVYGMWKTLKRTHGW